MRGALLAGTLLFFTGAGLRYAAERGKCEHGQQQRNCFVEFHFAARTILGMDRDLVPLCAALSLPGKLTNIFEFLTVMNSRVARHGEKNVVE